MCQPERSIRRSLFLPIAKGVQVALSVVAPIGAEAAMQITAALAGGAGVGIAYAGARECLESFTLGGLLPQPRRFVDETWFPKKSS